MRRVDGVEADGIVSPSCVVAGLAALAAVLQLSAGEEDETRPNERPAPAKSYQRTVKRLILDLMELFSSVLHAASFTPKPQTQKRP